MPDRLSGKGYGSTDSGTPFNITPSDSADMADTTRLLVVGGAGNIKLTDADGNTDTFAFPAGSFPVRVRRVWSTGTTATGVWGIK